MQNTRKKIVVLIPKIDSTGPVKGALALISGLKSFGADVSQMTLFEHDKPYQGIRKYVCVIKKLLFLRELQKTENAVIISSCFMPDLLVSLFLVRTMSITSLRGNLRENYRDSYGWPGLALAWLHYKVAGRLKIQTVLNTTMKNECIKLGMQPVMINNFIDELSLKARKRDEAPVGGGKMTRFIFIGSLTKRKAIVELVEIFGRVVQEFPDARLTVLGAGPELVNLENCISQNQLQDKVILCGQVNNPTDFLNDADVFVLPSYSEGTSRAAMEALYFGLPCIMRDVDSNNQLITTKRQGLLIDNETRLFEVMANYCMTDRTENRVSRLPEQFNQASCSKKYYDLVLDLV